MTDTERKKLKVLDLLFEVDDELFKQFFDADSEELLDEKIEVLTALKKGSVPADIPKYYDVLELYPQNQMWD